MVRTETKAAVLATLSSIGRGARKQGHDAWAAIQEAVPGIPSEVVAEVVLSIEDEMTASWWEQVEKTIDGEVVRSALGIHEASTSSAVSPQIEDTLRL